MAATKSAAGSPPVPQEPVAPRREGLPRPGQALLFFLARAIWAACRAVGGQYGHHNPSDHRRHTVASRWRLVRPRTVVLRSEFAYIDGMLWRNSRGRPLNAPAAFIHP
jgi:hypothetical protein